MISVVIPANDEAERIGACLTALIWSGPVAVPVEIVVAANGCTDATVDAARACRAGIGARGWSLTVLDLPGGGKIGALNAGDAAATPGSARIYLDADVTVGPGLLPALADLLARPGPVFASGRLRITAPDSWISRAYARVWARVPFMAGGVPGCGLYAVNAAGRARWGAFPDIIADDIFARLQFRPDERANAAAPYDWPVACGFGALVRVRRRQDAGVREIAARFPALMANDDKPRLGLRGLMRLALAAPVGFAVYAAVALGVRSRAPARGWSRGR